MPKKNEQRSSRRAVVAAFIAAVVLSFLVMNAGYVAARLSLRLRGPAPVPPAPARPETGTPPAAVPEPPRMMAPDRLQIPSLGLDVPLVYVQEKTEAAFQAGLRDGVVHYPGTAMPGEPGNAYYFGHSSDYVWSKGSYKNVFATLPEIKQGAAITVSGPDGRAYDYVVIVTRVVSPKDLSVLDQGDGTRSLLTLQTSYPLGTALKRFVAVAELVR
ncbi:MAG TPA: sortase [Candidatus Binatia bacterium]|jgi:sortase A|nr:sortase [Candidatus Binatia bacterium]